MDYEKKIKRRYMRNALKFIEKAKGKGVRIINLEKYSKYILLPSFISFSDSTFFSVYRYRYYKIERILAKGKITGFGMLDDVLCMVGKVYSYDTENKKYRKFILVPIDEYYMKALIRHKLKTKYEFALLLRKTGMYEVVLQNEKAKYKQFSVK